MGLAEEGGATAVEYGLMVAAIAAVIATIAFLLGTEVVELFRSLEGQGWF